MLWIIVILLVVIFGSPAFWRAFENIFFTILFLGAIILFLGSIIYGFYWLVSTIDLGYSNSFLMRVLLKIAAVCLILHFIIGKLGKKAKK